MRCSQPISWFFRFALCGFPTSPRFWNLRRRRNHPGESEVSPEKSRRGFSDVQWSGWFIGRPLFFPVLFFFGSSLGLIPDAVGDCLVDPRKSFPEEGGVANQEPVAEPVELAARGFQRGSPQVSVFFSMAFPLAAESDSKVHVFNRDQVLIEPADLPEGFGMDPEESAGDSMAEDKRRDQGRAADDPKRPALRFDLENSAADEFTGVQFPADFHEHVRAHPAVRVDRDQNIPRRPAGGRVPDLREIPGVFACDHRAPVPRDGLGSVGASVETNHGLDGLFDIAGRGIDGIEAAIDPPFFVVRWDQDRDHENQEARPLRNFRGVSFHETFFSGSGCRVMLRSGRLKTKTGMEPVRKKGMGTPDKGGVFLRRENIFRIPCPGGTCISRHPSLQAISTRVSPEWSVTDPEKKRSERSRINRRLWFGS